MQSRFLYQTKQPKLEKKDRNSVADDISLAVDELDLALQREISVNPTGQAAIREASK